MREVGIEESGKGKGGMAFGRELQLSDCILCGDSLNRGAGAALVGVARGAVPLTGKTPTPTEQMFR